MIYSEYFEHLDFLMQKIMFFEKEERTHTSIHFQYDYISKKTIKHFSHTYNQDKKNYHLIVIYDEVITDVAK